MRPTITDNDLTNLEYLGNELFEKAMKGRWSEVVDICTNNPFSMVARITRLEDTLLHLAVSGGLEETVRKLIDIMISSDLPNPGMLLGTKNGRGNTALHIAALMGNEAMCKCIASVDSSLIGERNNEGETPLYTAVFFGKKQAFQCLYHLCPANEHYSYSRKTCGDTILHRAISGDHLDLALRIIELYGEVLVNAVDEDGITPLHLLADKPSAFPSGSRLGFFQRLIYKCIYVDEHKVMEPDDHFFQRSMQPIERLPAYERNPNNYPENYRTCNDFYRLFWNFFTFLRLAMGLHVEVQTAKQNPEIAMGLHVEVQTAEENPKIAMGLHVEVQTTEENPEITMGLHVEVQTAEENPETSTINPEAWKRRLFPANYDVCCNFLKLANRIVLIVLGGGFPTIRKIYEEKQQHRLSIQIMNHLLKGVNNVSEFYYAGKEPSQPSDIAKLDTPRKDIQQDSNPFDVKFDNIHDHAEAENTEEGEGGRKQAEASRQQTNSTGGKESVADAGKKIATKNEPETAILIAARNGVLEIVKKIQELVPVAIHDVDAENKNAVLLAVENRQPHKYKLLLQSNYGTEITTKSEPETAILIAARNGVAEIVEKILDLFPVAIQDVNAENKNAVLLAVENRQPHIYNLLLKRNILNRESMFRVVDKDGNSAFHLAANLAAPYKPWQIPGEALQMQWEMKWYEFVTSSIPPNFVPRKNNKGQTPEEVFIETHSTLLNKGS